jgi:C4-dicarboxylate-specific signal transduction histidine kinase
VYYFLRKPWERDMLFSVLVRAIEAHDMSSANVALTERLLVADRCATLGHMAARVAHEMGNQLCMLPLLELIEEEYATQKPLIEMAAVTRLAYTRLVELINEVKAFARFDQREILKQKVSVTEVIAELVEFLRYDNTLRLDRLVVHIHSEPVVMASKVKLQQVLLNLLKNAAHAIHGRQDGAISVTLDTAEGQAVLVVRDNGCGMTPDVAERIWEPFFTTKGKHGNGLGLDVVNSVIETYGGTIRCKTAPGEGAEFTISLPLDETLPASVPLPSGAALGIATTLASFALTS